MSQQANRHLPTPAVTTGEQDRLLFLSVGVVMAGLVWMTSDILTMIVGYTLLLALGWRQVRGDLLHPIIWFGGGYLAYSAAGPFLAYLGIHPTPVWGGYELREVDFADSMRVEAIAGIACLLAIGTETVDVRRPLRDPTERWKLQSFAMPFFLAASLFCLFFVRHISASGITRKIDLVAQGDTLSRTSFAFVMLCTLSTALLTRLILLRRYIAVAVISMGLLTLFLLVVLIVGQRNYFFRFSVLLAFLAIAFGWRPKLWTLVPLAVTGAILAAVLGAFKMSFLATSGKSPDMAAANVTLAFIQRAGIVGLSGGLAMKLELIAYAALGTELMTPGTNLALMIAHWPNTFDQVGFTNIAEEIRTALVPGFLMGREDLPQTSSVVFLNTFFPGAQEEGIGYGFSLVGVGYMSMGTVGAMILMALYGYALRVIYRNAERGLMSFLFFLNVVPLAIFTLRADTATFLSQSWKHVGLPLLLLYAANTAARQPAR